VAAWRDGREEMIESDAAHSTMPIGALVAALDPGARRSASVASG
jgi:hypothetical protein